MPFFSGVVCVLYSVLHTLRFCCRGVFELLRDWNDAGFTFFGSVEEPNLPFSDYSSTFVCFTLLNLLCF